MMVAWRYLCAIGLLVLGTACQKSGGVPPRDPIDASIDIPEYQCPARDPRIGSACKAPAKTRCSYDAETCSDGRMHSRTYCCFMGGWEMCGTSEPCPPPEAEEDEPTLEMSVEPADAGSDGSGDPPPDLGPDVPLCAGEEAPDYCDPGQLPCLPCPGGGHVPCTCFAAKWLCEVCPSDGGAA